MSEPIDLLASQKQHLANMLEAIQRCVYFLESSVQSVPWPLDAKLLKDHKKDADLFESLSAINERFAKLQDALGAAMRHSLILSGDQTDSFLKLLALFEKKEIIESREQWILCRTARNLAAHEYDVDYAIIAQHFNTLYALRGFLYSASGRFLHYCASDIQTIPATSDFSEEFQKVVGEISRTAIPEKS